MLSSCRTAEDMGQVVQTVVLRLINPRIRIRAASTSQVGFRPGAARPPHRPQPGLPAAASSSSARQLWPCQRTRPFASRFGRPGFTSAVRLPGLLEWRRVEATANDQRRQNADKPQEQNQESASCNPRPGPAQGGQRREATGGDSADQRPSMWENPFRNKAGHLGHQPDQGVIRAGLIGKQRRRNPVWRELPARGQKRAFALAWFGLLD